MIEELRLRSEVYKDSFRFEVGPSIWRTLYAEGTEAKNVISILENGVLKGYAVYSIFVRNDVKAFGILDICADEEKTMKELIDCIIKRGAQEKADFIYIRKRIDSSDDIFDKKGFISFIESIIMVVLLDPKQLLSSLSKKIESGRILKLAIEGFEPVTVKVGEESVEVVGNEKPELTILTDKITFVRLFFGNTSFLRELLRGKLKVHGMLKLRTAIRFFNIIKQKKWYIPFGDWS